MPEHPWVRGEGSSGARWWPILLAAGLAFITTLGVAIADHRLHAPYPILDLNEEWGEALLAAASRRPVGVCGNAIIDTEVIVVGAKPRPPRPPAPPPPQPPPLSSRAAIGWMIEARIDHAMPDVQRCFTAARRARPELSGEWSFRFTVLPSGATGGVSVVGDTQRDTTLETCLAELAQGWIFHPIDRPQPVTFKLPIERPAEREERPVLSDPAAIERMITTTIARNERRFERCYEYLQHHEPQLVGPRTLRFVVQPDGVPAQTTALSDRPEPDVLERCVIDVASGLRFEPVHKVQTVTVQLPLDG